MIYTSLYVMIFDAGRFITWARGRGLDPGNLEFFEPQMGLAYRLAAISQGPKSSLFPGPNPLPLALVMKLHTSKTLLTGRINHRCINSYNMPVVYMALIIFWAQIALASLVAISGPKKVLIFRAHPFQRPWKWICPHQNHYVLHKIKTGTLVILCT